MGIEFRRDKSVLKIIENGVEFYAAKKIDNCEFEFMWEASQEKSMNKFINVDINEFPIGLFISGPFYCKEFGLLNFVSVQNLNGVGKIGLSITAFYEEWSNPYTMNEYFELLARYLVEEGTNCRPIRAEFGISIDMPEFKFSDGFIGQQIKERAIELSILHNRVENHLIKDKSVDLISKLFKFPSHYEVICTQYLLWFGELLQSLGIEASVSTENKNGHTFLAIDPRDNPELTQDIEKALHLYLGLPYSELLPAEHSQNDLLAKIEFQQLQHQVQMFQQQIEIKSSLLDLEVAKAQVKDNKILLLENELSIAREKVMLLESMQDNKLDIFDGTFTISAFKLGPVQVNPKRLVDKLSKNKDKKK